MPLPRFSEALVERRRELGLSIAQASRTLKLREDVLVAFEEGDYDHMPQSGYAQGMLSSYARYLGLNAREIVDLFQEEVYEYRHGTSSHELRRRTRQTQSGRGIAGYEMPNEAGSRPKAYVEYRPLLPSGGGPAGAMGDFETTAAARPRTSAPLAGSSNLVLSSQSYSRTSGSSYSGREESNHRSHDPRGSARPYNAPSSRERSGASTARHRPPSSRRRGDDKASRLINERQYRSGVHDGRGYLRDDVSTRRVRRGEYTDDLRLDDRANPYAPASTISGRRSSRNIANIERPNVRRRSPRGSARASGRGRTIRRDGIVGVVAEFLSDPRRALFALIVLLVVALTAILTFSVSSCVSGKTQAPTTGQVVTVDPAGTSDDAQGDQDGQTAQDDAQQDDSQGDDATAEPGADGTDAEDPDADGESPEGGDAADSESDATDEPEEPKETVVEVSVANGQVSWVEITCDGTSDVAESVTGPWSQSYTVRDSITIQVANPDVVTVTENGERRDFSSHAGGLGSVTIEGTPLPEEDGDSADGTSATDQSGEADGSQ